MFIIVIVGLTEREGARESEAHATWDHSCQNLIIQKNKKIRHDFCQKKSMHH